MEKDMPRREARGLTTGDRRPTTCGTPYGKILAEMRRRGNRENARAEWLINPGRIGAGTKTGAQLGRLNRTPEKSPALWRRMGARSQGAAVALCSLRLPARSMTRLGRRIVAIVIACAGGRCHAGEERQGKQS
jgi:hypothetical protein